MDLTNVRGIVFDVDGVLSPSTIPMDSEGLPVRLMNVKDGYAIQLAVKKGLKLAIISGGRSKAVALRYRSLGIDDVFMGASFKLPVLEQWMEQTGLDASQVVFVGDDIPDLPVMQAAGTARAPADACPEVLAAADYVVPCNGGYGVARHLIEQVFKARGCWLDERHAFGW